MNKNNAEMLLKIVESFQDLLLMAEKSRNDYSQLNLDAMKGYAVMHAEQSSERAMAIVDSIQILASEVNRYRKESEQQHDEVVGRLRMINDRIKRLEEADAH